jgi:retron-type reverse transcriptase
MSMDWMIPGRRGPYAAFLEKWRVNAAKTANYPPHAMASVADKALELIVSKENLKLAWDYLGELGGQAPGPNGQTFRDFTRVGAWKEIDRLHAELASGVYRHGAVRRKRVQKRLGSTGTRPLAIPNIQDRVVGRGETQVLEPLFAPRFDERSFCRFGRGPGHALAHAKLIAERENRWIWIAEDIRGAFEHVPLERLFKMFYSYLPSDRLLDLIRRSVDDRRGDELYQGAPLSPLLMNV